MVSNKTIKIAKEELRVQFLSRRSSLGGSQLHEFYEKICKHLLNFVAQQKIETLFLFWPQRSEIDIRPVIQSSGCEVLLPRVTEQKGIMNFHVFSSEEELEVNRFGIYEPKANAPIKTPNKNSLMVVPALAIDHSGHRLGYGGGYYDRYLAIHAVRTVACILDCFTIPMIPSDQFDMRVDGVATQSQIKWFIPNEN